MIVQIIYYDIILFYSILRYSSPPPQLFPARSSKGAMAAPPPSEPEPEAAPASLRRPDHQVKGGDKCHNPDFLGLSKNNWFWV